MPVEVVLWCQLPAPAPAPQATAVRGYGQGVYQDPFFSWPHTWPNHTWRKIRWNYNTEDLANSNLAPLTINLRKSNLAKPIQTWPAYQAKNLKWSGYIERKAHYFALLFSRFFFVHPLFFSFEGAFFWSCFSPSLFLQLGFASKGCFSGNLDFFF